MNLIFYNIFLAIYKLAIRLVALWNPKARKWVEGRKFKIEKSNTIGSELDKYSINNIQSKIIWMHCASVGEFEQGRPVLEKLKDENAKLKVVLTFFSPSGYEACKNYQGADFIFYLPLDGKQNAKAFIDTINPSLVLWVKYEYWYYYLAELKNRNIPVLLISGIFRNNQLFFKWYGKGWLKVLHFFTHLFVQNEESQKLLDSIGMSKNVTLSGDTRFDRVIEIVASPFEFLIIEAFCKHHHVIVAGSTWQDDEIILAAYSDETKHREKIILVPHELDAAHLSDVKRIFKKSIFYSEIENNKTLLESINDYDTLIVDKMGMLSRLYSYGYVNYVGGGFTNDGIHNILEAAVWGKPIVIGENFEKYFEAVDLIDNAAAENISDVNELKEVMQEWIEDKASYESSGEAAQNYVNKNGGATELIIKFINEENLLLK